mmetsp:Transcript_56642/g.127822  ORF Transcript_56642/g.127822 Transcript_56642/m.127822 type:complete len:213 (+) Transcript_56642:478-1116(+)
MFTRGPDDADRGALLPALLGVGGEAPDGLCLELIGRIVGVTAIVVRGGDPVDGRGEAGVGVEAGAVRGGVVVRAGGVPILAEDAAVRARPDAAVVRAVARAVLAGRFVPRDGIADSICPRNHYVDPRLLRSGKEACVLALVAADEGKDTTHDEDGKDHKDRKPDAEPHCETEHHEVDEAHDKGNNADDDEGVYGLLEVTDPRAKGLRGTLHE